MTTGGNHDNKGFYQTSIDPFTSDGCPRGRFGSYCVLYTKGCEKWDGTHVSISMVMLALLINLF